MSAKIFTVRETDKNFDLRDSDGNPLEPSAIEPVDKRLLLVADDQGGDLYAVAAADGKVVQTLEFKDFKKPKWEAMARDGENFYIVGSHAVKLDDDDLEKLTKKLAARSNLLRFRLKKTDDGESLEIDPDSLVRLNVSESLKAAGIYDEDPRKNRCKIEGLAFRRNAEGKRELIFALREPHDLMRVFFAGLNSPESDGDRLALEPFFSFEAGAVGAVPFRLSSIEYVPDWQGFFVLTSTEDGATNNFFGNALWFASDDSLGKSLPERRIAPAIVRLFAADMKAEGLCVLPGATGEKLRLAIVFDNDFEDTGKPGQIEIIEISRA